MQLNSNPTEQVILNKNGKKFKQVSPNLKTNKSAAFVQNAVYYGYS